MQHLYFNVCQSLSLSREYLNIHLPYLLCILNKSTGSTFFLAQHKMYKYIKEVFIRQEFTDLNHFIFIHQQVNLLPSFYISVSQLLFFSVSLPRSRNICKNTQANAKVDVFFIFYFETKSKKKIFRK